MPVSNASRIIGDEVWKTSKDVRDVISLSKLIRKSDGPDEIDVGETFQPRYLPQQSQYYTSPVYRPMHTMHDQSYAIGLSPETKQKIDEFTRLMNKYPQFHTNPNGIIRWAINGAVKGDNQFLDEKLEQLRIIDFYKA